MNSLQCEEYYPQEYPGRENEENCPCSYCQEEWEETPRLRELSAPDLGKNFFSTVKSLFK